MEKPVTNIRDKEDVFSDSTVGDGYALRRHLRSYGCFSDELGLAVSLFFLMGISGTGFLRAVYALPVTQPYTSCFKAL